MNGRAFDLRGRVGSKGAAARESRPAGSAAGNRTEQVCLFVYVCAWTYIGPCVCVHTFFSQGNSILSFSALFERARLLCAAGLPPAVSDCPSTIIPQQMGAKGYLMPAKLN